MSGRRSTPYGTEARYGPVVSLADAWEEHAAEWITWARTPGHDGFWEGTWPALRAILPAAIAGPVLDLGCGEGRTARQVAALGHLVIAVDRSSTLASAAASGEPPLPVVRGDACALPFAPASFGLVVASMVLHDLDELNGACREIARVLRTSGSLCGALVHPFCTAQDDDTLHTDEFRVSRRYLEPRRYEDHAERDGLAMTFVSTHRPLADYVNALADTGMVITAMSETGDRAVPWLLTFRAEIR